MHHCSQFAVTLVQYECENECLLNRTHLFIITKNEKNAGIDAICLVILNITKNWNIEISVEWDAFHKGVKWQT